MIGCARHKTVWGLMLVSVGASAFAKVDVSAWQVQHWTTEQGWRRSTTVALAQAKDGYVWVGTREGLARFDGVQFTAFVNELFVSEPGDAGVLQICVDEQEGVWIRTREALIFYRGGQFTRYSFKS